MRRALVLAVAVIATFGTATASARTVRVFAMGPKLSLDWIDSRQHFHDKLLALFDRSLRAPSAPVIQQGADDVASHLRPDGANLVTLPEDVGLFAIFADSRGTGARNATDVVSAIVGVLGTYAPQAAYYDSKYPGLAGRPLPTRSLALAATDTFGRIAVETFAELAQRYHVWLVAGVNMAQSWHVVCNDRATMPALPTGETCDEVDPAKVAQLKTTDEPDRTYAYEATTDRASNMALVFDPSGKLVSRQVKTYLTPTELPSQLDLLPGEVSGGLTPVDTAVGRLGIVTSKDAWMPDVVAKLDEAHVNLLVQPEFFIGDTVRATGMWSPDNSKAAGYSDLLRQPSFDAMALPSMTGNIFDLSADNQSAIAVRPRGRHPPQGNLVGQQPAPGYLAVEPWAVTDPATAAILDRRRALAAAGAKMLPDAANPACPAADFKGACRGGQQEDVTWADVSVGDAPALHRTRPRPHGSGPFGPARPIDPSSAAQRNVVLAARGRLAWAAFEERRGGHDRVLVARSTDAGAHWRRPVALAGKGDQQWPSISVGPDGVVWLAYQQDRRIRVARSADGGRTFPKSIGADDSSPANQWKPSIAATGTNRAFVAWVDERDRFTVDDLPRANVYGATVRRDQPSPARRIDTAPTVDDNAKQMDNDWAPSVAARGTELVVTWLDFGAYDWDVVARRSHDGGASFGSVAPVNDTPVKQEALNDTPRAAVGPDGPLIAWTDYRKRADDATDLSPHPLYDIDIAAPDGLNRRVDDHGAAQVDTFWPSLAVLPNGDALVAWQDDATGFGAIRISRVRRGSAGRRPVRVDDGGARPEEHDRPAVALTGGGRVLAAWEDGRDGPSQVYAASASAGSVR